MNTEVPSVSVIVRTARQERRFLHRALASIRSQTARPAEVIVINVGTDPVHTDVTVKAAGLDNVAVHHVAKLNRPAAANAGLAAAQEEWVTFLDDDDTWHPEFLARTSSVFARANPTCGGVVTRTVAVYERLTARGLRQIRRESFNPTLLAIDLAALACENRFTNNALVFRRAAVAEIGSFREDLAALDDWEFNVRLAVKYPLEVIPEELAFYHLRPASDAEGNVAPMAAAQTAVQIRNEWLRADMAAGRLGLGQLAMAGETAGANRTLRLFERWRARLRRLWK